MNGMTDTARRVEGAWKTLRVGWRRSLGRSAFVLALLLGASAAARAEEFVVTSRWQYPAKPLPGGSLLAHGQADIFDASTNDQIGGIGYYCARPATYVDIFVHEPGRPMMYRTPANEIRATELHWGYPTFRGASLKLNGVVLPASVERGVVYVDIDAKTGPVLADAFTLKTAGKRLDVDVPKLATFTLAMKRIEPRTHAVSVVIVDFDEMVRMCQSTLGQ
jgi:hypothetical protein